MVNTPLKFTGHGTEGGYRSVAQSQGASLESFYGIKPRRFHVSNGDSVPFIASASSLLASRQERMTSEEWRGFIDGQLSRWYGRTEAKGVSLVTRRRSGGIRARAALKTAYRGCSRAGCPAASHYRAERVCRHAEEADGREPQAARPCYARALPAAETPAHGDTNVATKPPAEGYEPEVEISPGVFHARKKPRFPRP